jgi:hypothetical protein
MAFTSQVVESRTHNRNATITFLGGITSRAKYEVQLKQWTKRTTVIHTERVSSLTAARKLARAWNNPK